MAHKKPNLPEKICVVCQLPFSWRKKWEKNWDEVKYCSEKCIRNKSALKKQFNAISPYGRNNNEL